FPSADGLVRGTLTGRNFGWLPSESAAAIAHIAQIIRDDDGATAEEYGLVPYRAALLGAAWLPASLRIPAELRLDVNRASDDQIAGAVAKLTAAYIQSLQFPNDTPSDRFPAKNALPLAPEGDEAPLDYARRLRGALDALTTPAFVGGEDGH